MGFSFLPTWPLSIDGLVVFGGIVLIGLLGGRVAHYTGFLPRISGFILIGFLFGPSILNILSLDMISRAEVFVDIALGLILFQLGWRLDIQKLRHDHSLLVTGILESAASFFLIYVVLVSLNVGPIYAAMAAALGISTSPAVVLLVVRELGASGPVTERSLNLVAINNVTAFIAFSLILPFIHLAHHISPIPALLQPAYQFIGALTLAYVLCWLLVRLGRLLGKSESMQFALLVGMIVLAIGMAKMLNVSTLFTLLGLGIMARNLDKKQDLMETEFGHSGEIFFVILFVLAGATLHVSELAQVGWAAPAFVLARFLGKSLVVFVASRRHGLSNVQSVSLGFTLVPMAGLAIGLTQTASAMYPEFGAKLSAIIVASVAILETIGPVMTEIALKRSGEAGVSGQWLRFGKHTTLPGEPPATGAEGARQNENN